MNKTARKGVEERLMQMLIPFLCLSLLATSAPARSSVRPSKSKTQTVLVLGDSISAGYGLRRSDAYPALLSEKAIAAGIPVRVINGGVSGDTTAGALRRLPALLRRERIDAMVIELGINDAFRGVPVAQIETNLQKIIDQTRASYPKVRIVIAGMQLPNYSAGDYLSEFGALFAAVAKRNNAALVPFLLQGVVGQPGLNQADHIHPNAAGQKILAANVWPVLESILKKVSRPHSFIIEHEHEKVLPTQPASESRR